MNAPGPLRRHAAKAVVLAAVVPLAIVSQQPAVGDDEVARLASGLSFSHHELPPVATHGWQHERTVADDYAPISAWMSAVGAAVALGDLDGNGLEDDSCLVDPRTDTITVQPVPGTGERYEPFAVQVTDLPYDRTTMAPTGCLPVDLDQDGRLDLLTYYWGRSPVAFLSTGGAPAQDAFVQREVAGTAQDWATDSVLATDLDGDGGLDLVVGNYFPDESGLLGGGRDATSSMAMHSSMSNAQNGGGLRLLRLRDADGGGDGPDVRYEDVSAAVPEQARERWTLAMAAQDLDGDQRPELFVSNDFGPDQLLVNRSRPGEVVLERAVGRRSPAVPRSKTLGRDSFKGMGVDFADLDGDGRTDLFVSNLTSPSNLVESNQVFVADDDAAERLDDGVAAFRDRSEQTGLARTGWAWDVKADDLDDDGRPEILQANGFVKGEKNLWPQLQELALANDLVNPRVGAWPRFPDGADLSGDEPNRLWKRSAGGRWVDVADQVGIAQPLPSRGMATADVDGDGDLDVAIANQWGPSAFYRNDSETGRSLHLRLARPTRPGAAAPTTTAVGAEVSVTLPDGSTRTAQVDHGNGHASARGHEVHVGLGDVADAPLPVTVTWRDLEGEVHRSSVRLAPGRHVVDLAATLQEAR